MGVAKITGQRKIDIIMHTDAFYTHKQIERKNNMIFMRLKRRQKPLMAK